MDYGLEDLGDSPFAVRFDVGGHVFIGDEPIEAGGAGLGPAPFQLLSAALAECTAMTVRWYARQHKWPVEHISVQVSYSRISIEGRSVASDTFSKTVDIRGDALTQEQRKRLLEIAAKCPVQRTLQGGAAITTVAGELL